MYHKIESMNLRILNENWFSLNPRKLIAMNINTETMVPFPIMFSQFECAINDCTLIVAPIYKLNET